MPSCSKVLSQVGFAKNQIAPPSTDSHQGTLKPEDNKEEEEEEEEDEDADFNPFLRETPSQQASSSLSSEVDGLDGNVVNSWLSKPNTEEQSCNVIYSEHGEEEIILQSLNSLDESCKRKLTKNSNCNSKRRKPISLSETKQEKYIGLTSSIDGNDVRISESSNTTKSNTPVIDTDSEDAICMRTRARYSLASFTLDELETFLQETDDDDDLQNADDEEEYRKFLAAVLQGGDGDGLSMHANENLDDEDEDNDADFEIELQELLESDVDEKAAVNTRKEYDGAGRRPETRQNKRQKASAQSEKKMFGQVKRPLRPILPSWYNGQLGLGKGLMPEATVRFQSSASGNCLVNGFTPQQIGQLHYLIHEHVQLLIQVFSLSVLEPSQKQIASQVQGLLLEMLHKRNEVLALKIVPYPSICFTPSYACEMASDGSSKFASTQCNIEPASTDDAQRVCSPLSNQSTSEGRCEYILDRPGSCSQDTESSFWFPSVRGPLQSILDVSPLNLVAKYVDEIDSAVQDCRKQYFESGCDFRVEKEPLFPCSASFAGANSDSGTVSGAVNTVSTSAGQQPKKTLAAMLVESTKKQSIALVPKEVAKLTQRFLPFFSAVLFPHKPPPAAVVNRVLFTDSEDELLALGIMEYNTDWKAIQQRFLPCKSKHQIFVRQKNRCSSKAPENPIKAVRRMKTSPLTAEEIARIQEGLKVYKFDWMSVWQYIVPHRDPSLLPRQWRIALGTQKSYKIDASKREKRRLYESKRRKLKAAALESCQPISDKEDCEAEIAGPENCIDYSDGPYVHQAFLADWRPDPCTLAQRFSTTYGEENLGHDAISLEGTQLYGDIHNYGFCGKAQHQNGNQTAFSSVSKLPQPFHTTTDLSGIKGAPGAIKTKNPGIDMTSSSKFYYRPYRSRRANSTHLVKLAPDLPPVNLPPSVRVVSQTAFKGYPCGTTKIYPPGVGLTACRKDNSASQTPHVEKFGPIHPVKPAGSLLKDSVTGSQLERSGTAEGRSIVAEKNINTDLQMHPLLFQTTKDGSLPYYPLKFSSGTSSSFSFFSGTQPHLNLSLFHSPQQPTHIDYSNNPFKSKDSISWSCGIDFHPLLQKSNDAQLQTCFDAIPTEPLVESGVPAIANRSSSLNDKSNELDLEIHLSSVSGKEKTVKSRQLKAHDSVGSSNCQTATKPQEDRVPFFQPGEKNSSVNPFSVPNVNITRYDVDDIGDQSHPEIVMEQEELSDSEEDIEEHVEFECEEMADSEGEDGSGYEQGEDVQNKVPATASLKEVALHTVCMKETSEQRANSDTQVDDILPTRTSRLNAALTSEEKDDKSCSSWLSLDSRTADNPVLSKAELEGGTIDEASDSVDMVKQLSLGTLVFAALQKPKKRTGKSSANLNVGLTVENSSLDDNNENS